MKKNVNKNVKTVLAKEERKVSSCYFIENLISQGRATGAPGQVTTRRLAPRGQQMNTLIVPGPRPPDGGLAVNRYLRSHPEPGERK